MKNKGKQGINIELEMNNNQNRDYLLPSNENILSSDSPESSKKNWKIIIGILLGSIIVLGGVAALVYIFVIGDKSEPPESPLPNSPFSPQWPEDLNITKAKKVFSPLFNVSSKERTLNQLSQKSFQKYETIVNGQKSSYFTLNKAIYDIYTINTTLAQEYYKINFF